MLASHTGEELYDDIENAGQNNRPHSWVFVRTELHIMHTDNKEIIIMNHRRVIGSEMQEEKPTIKVQTTREKREEVMDCSCNLIH